MRSIASALGCALLLTLGACVNGPVRYSVLGDAEYATADFASDVSPPLVPFAVLGGVITDAGLVVGDTVCLFGTGLAFGPYAPFWYVSKGKADPWWAWAAPVTIPVSALVIVPAAGMIWPSGGDYSLLTGIEPAEGPYGRSDDEP